MKNHLFIFYLLFSSSLFAQSNIDEVLKNQNKKSVSYIYVNELKSRVKSIILDVREQKEFNVSHIKNAICVGYDKFNEKNILTTYKNLNDTIIVYCSVGIRSEKIGEKLLHLGYKNVLNLYGGIFEWKNKGNLVVNNNNQKTEKVHTFNKQWSIYLKSGIAIYEK